MWYIVCDLAIFNGSLTLGIAGTPMILPFVQLYDRPPTVGESDVVLGDEDFRGITSGRF